VGNISLWGAFYIGAHSSTSVAQLPSGCLSSRKISILSHAACWGKPLSVGESLCLLEATLKSSWL